MFQTPHLIMAQSLKSGLISCHVAYPQLYGSVCHSLTTLHSIIFPCPFTCWSLHNIALYRGDMVYLLAIFDYFSWFPILYYNSMITLPEQKSSCTSVFLQGKKNLKSKITYGVKETDFFFFLRFLILNAKLFFRKVPVYTLSSRL